jgi:hypothetical protein
MKKILVTVLFPLFLFSCGTPKSATHEQATQRVDDYLFGRDGSLFLGRATEIVACDASIYYSRAGAPENFINKLTHALPKGESVMLGSRTYAIIRLEKGYYHLMPQDSLAPYSLFVTLQTDSILNATQVEHYFAMHKLCHKVNTKRY